MRGGRRGPQLEMDTWLELTGNLKGWVKLWNILFFSFESEGNVLGLMP